MTTANLSQAVDWEQLASLKLLLQMGAGRLNLGANTSKLLEVSYSNPQKGEPIVCFSKNDGQGILEVKQKPQRGFFLDRAKGCDWDVYISNQVPIDAKLQLGSGESRIHLGALRLKTLEVNNGVGDCTLSLLGFAGSLQAKAATGMGHLTILLPKNVGVRVVCQRGLGTVDIQGLLQEGEEYFNQAWQTGDKSIELEATAGMGKLEIISAE